MAVDTAAADQLKPRNSASFYRLLVTQGTPAVGVALKVVTSDALLLTQDANVRQAGAQHVPNSVDLEIYADVLTICGPLELPGRTVKLFCREFRTQSDSNRRTAAIRV